LNTPTPFPFLANNDIHVWLAELNPPKNDLVSLQASLSDDELDRANRFVQPIHCDRFIAARGILRQFLARYLNLKPHKVIFDANAFGKPFVKQAIFFNVAHSHDYALFAFSRNCELGIDIECIDPKVDCLNLAKRFFSQREQDELEKLNPEQQQQGFFNAWTRKEAFIKAVGKGLSFPLDKFSVSLVPGQPFEIIRVDDEQLADQHWTTFAFESVPGYASALVSTGSALNLQYFAKEIGVSFTPFVIDN